METAKSNKALNNTIHVKKKRQKIQQRLKKIIKIAQ